MCIDILANYDRNVLVNQELMPSRNGEEAGCCGRLATGGYSGRAARGNIYSTVEHLFLEKFVLYHTEYFLRIVMINTV